MDFVNTTTFHGGFLNTGFGEDRLLACLIVRPTFKIEGAKLIPVEDELWPIDAAPMETPYGECPGDLPFLNGGIDVFLLGNAYQRAQEPAPSLQVDINVGPDFHRSFMVFGNRYWRSNESEEDRIARIVEADEGKNPPEPELFATDPEPFVTMPLTYENAYGGKSKFGDAELPWSPNAEGKGYYTNVDEAEGGPLPNIEHPEHLIQTYRDQPPSIAGAPYPSSGSLRPMNALDVEIDEDEPENSRIKRIKPLVFNQAHPQMIVEPGHCPLPGDLIEVTNVRPEGDLRFPMPYLPMHAHVQLEDRQYIFPLHLDQIGICAETLHVFFSYRVVFRYRMAAMERRRTTLHSGEAPQEIPDEYVAVWEDWDAGIPR